MDDGEPGWMTEEGDEEVIDEGWNRRLRLAPTAAAGGAYQSCHTLAGDYSGCIPSGYLELYL